MDENPRPSLGGMTGLRNTRVFPVSTVGGTFNTLHLGHVDYLKIALAISDIVHISMTSDRYAAALKSYEVRPFDVRLKELKSFLESMEAINRTMVHCLESRRHLTTFIMEAEFNVAVVEPRYFKLFQKLNDRRKTLNLQEYCILLKPRTRLGGVEISSTALQGYPETVSS
jgi:pantetheine-phosphate adenylyltransferase